MPQLMVECTANTTNFMRKYELSFFQWCTSYRSCINMYDFVHTYICWVIFLAYTYEFSFLHIRTSCFSYLSVRVICLAYMCMRYKFVLPLYVRVFFYTYRTYELNVYPICTSYLYLYYIRAIIPTLMYELSFLHLFVILFINYTTGTWHNKSGRFST